MNKNFTWQNLYIFISSTFNDMHAERDYLVKRVFPELRIWCAERRIKLIDIDLRWGVSEKDATENKRVVDVCLQNIDKCRPFFLCFLGQRRGWVPQTSDVNVKTAQNYPELEHFLGKQSITELEIIHALMRPLDQVHEHVRHAFFYFRTPDYLSQISSPGIRNLFAPSETNVAYENFKKYIQEHYSVEHYSARWNATKYSPELVNANGQDLSHGRLDEFSVNGISLNTYILEQLKAAIEEEFPNRELIVDACSDLDIELLHQNTFMFQLCDSYIPRPIEEQKVLDYLSGNNTSPYIIKADAGSGKTSLLAHLISENKFPGVIFYRFLGTSMNSSDTPRTLALLIEEMKMKNLLTENEIEKAGNDLMLAFPRLLETASKKAHFTIIFDALDQWKRPADDIYWLPSKLPEGVKLVLSIRSDGDKQLLEKLNHLGFPLSPFGEMNSPDEKTLFIQGYLAQFLKDISPEQMLPLLALKGSSNPLYLKIVLNELRMHGSFDTLIQQLQKDYGKTPVDAFSLVLDRLEKEEYSNVIDSRILTTLFLGVMAHSLEGIQLRQYIAVFRNTFDNLEASDDDIMDGVYALAQHLSPYLIIDGGHVNYLYESFRQAVQMRYQEYYELFHLLLADIYENYCTKNGEDPTYQSATRSDLICLAYHVLHADEEAFMDQFTNAFFLLYYVKRAGFLEVTDTLMQADAFGYQSPHFKELANCIRRAGARLDANSNCLFFEIQQNVRSDNPLVKPLLEQASKYMQLQYFRPFYEENGHKLIADREMIYHEFPDRTDIFICKDYIVYVTTPTHRYGENTPGKISTIYLQNVFSEKIDSFYPLPYLVHRVSADEDYLYIESRLTTNPEEMRFEIYALPSLNLIFSKIGRPEAPSDFLWYTYCHGYNGAFYEVCIAKFPPLRIRIYRINDEKMMLEMTWPPEKTSLTQSGTIETLGFDINLCGPFLLENNRDYEQQRLWFIPTGTLLQEDSNHYDTFSGSISGQTFYYCNHKRPYSICTKYHFTDTTVEHVCTKKLFTTSECYFKTLAVVNNHLFALDDSGNIYVYDEDLNFIGYKERGFGIDLISTLDSNFHYVDDTLLLANDVRLYHYKFKDLLAMLDKKESEMHPTSSRSALMLDNNLYLLGHISKKIDLKQMECVCDRAIPNHRFVRTDQHNHQFSPAQTYQINGTQYILGHYGGKYCEKFSFGLMSLEDFKFGVQYADHLPEDIWLSAAYYDNWQFGLIFESDTVTDNYHTISVHIHNLDRDTSLAEVWEPDIKCRTVQIITVHNSNYMMCFGTYLADGKEELRIYDLRTRKIIFTYKHSSSAYISQTNIWQKEYRIYFTAHPDESETYVLIELNLQTLKMESFPIFKSADGTPNIVNATEKEIFFYVYRTKTILILSLETHRIVSTIDVRKHPGCITVFRKYGAILNFQSEGFCDVYHPDTGEFMMRHLLPLEIDTVLDCPGKPYFYVGTNYNQEYNFFKLGSTKEMS